MAAGDIKNSLCFDEKLTVLDCQGMEMNAERSGRVVGASDLPKMSESDALRGGGIKGERSESATKSISISDK